MNNLSYAMLEPNVGKTVVDGAQVKVTWVCPVSGRAVAESTSSMSADTSLTSRVGASVKRSLASELFYGAARFVSNAIGGPAGRIISNAAYTAANELNTRTTASVDYSEASRQAAVVLAFDAVKASFAWDEQRGRFVGK